ncbi:hypothetical protein DXG03_001875 [Asterophora parasitica]|uniref:Uncharacterized protein n=1 Tax=Asterophora parasitica TaxID=117018 RepID=A0A9P7G2Y5_9AGAR|nr:hypothetical protein DXG03_001875 [Asterophora parasitica]
MPRVLAIDNDARMPRHHHQNTKARAADISRLLDPSYTKNARASTSSAAYVDRHGDLHDPDYRHFPVAQKRHIAARPRWELIDEDALADDDDGEWEQEHTHRHRDTSFSSYQQQQHRSPSSSYTFHPVPRHTHHTHHHHYAPHSFDSADTVLDSVDEHTYLTLSNKPCSSHNNSVTRIIRDIKTKHRRRSLDASSRKSSTTTASDLASSPFWYPSPTPETTVSAVSEIEEEEVEEEEGGQGEKRRCGLSAGKRREEEGAGEERHHRTLSKRRRSVASSNSNEPPHAKTRTRSPNRRHSSSSSSDSHSPSSNLHHHTNNTHSSSTSANHTFEYTPSTPSSASASVYGDHNSSWTPTCGQALRRQWQALSLSVRFGVFRAQRRVRSRLGL